MSQLKLNDRVKDLRLPVSGCTQGVITYIHRDRHNPEDTMYVIIWDDGCESWCLESQLEKEVNGSN